MSSRNVAIRQAVYEALRREKRPHESFTQLFVRLMNQRGPLEELRGSWPKTPTTSDTRAWRRLRYGRSFGGAGR